MTTRMSVDVLEALALSMRYFAGELDEIAAKYRERLENIEKREDQVRGPGRHRIENLSGQMSGRLNHALLRNFMMRYNNHNPDIEDLSNLTRQDVMKFRDLGMNSMKELDGLMREYGIDFKGEKDGKPKEDEE